MNKQIKHNKIMQNISANISIDSRDLSDFD